MGENKRKVKLQSKVFIVCVIVVLISEILTLLLKGKTLSDGIATAYGIIVALSYVALIIGFVALICMILYENTYHYFENQMVKKVLILFYASVAIDLFSMMMRLIAYETFWSIINVIAVAIMLGSVIFLEYGNHHKYDEV